MPVMVAAAIFIAMGGFIYWSALLRGGERYTTPIGGLSSVPLKDGSRITLNTDTSVQVRVTATERHVSLEKGEAYFEVAKDPTRRFVVSVSDRRVAAVGTKFSVRREADGVRIVVTEGSVSLERAGPQSAGTQILPVGTVVRATSAAALIEATSPSDAEEYVAWLHGVLIFRDVTLGKAAEEFNRYNSQKIVVDAPAISGLRIAGSFRAHSVVAFVRLLEHGYPVRALWQPGQITLTSRGTS
jgi:transmembrane sensor